MTVLVMGTDRWAIEQAEEAFIAAGHRVVRCHEPGEPVFPCVALAHGRCDVESGRVDVACSVRARPQPAVAPLEQGATCALRRGIPLVVAGRTAIHPFAQYAAEVIPARDLDEQVLQEVVSVCERIASDPDVAV